jgi:ABC-type lipoprotein release transport system permease subunit
VLARHWNLASLAAENVARNGRGYAVAAAGLVLVLALFIAGVAISEGVKTQALDSIASGADVYCTWNVFGRDAAVPREAVAQLERVEGVLRAVPRIVGRAPLGGEIALVIGVPLSALEGQPIPLRGALPNSPAQVLVGCELARSLGLAPGAHVALEADTLRVFEVSGIVDGTAALWSAKALLCDLAEAQEVFGEREHVSDVCLYTRPGYAELVAQSVPRLDARFRVQTRSLVEAYVQRGMTLREGVFSVLLALVIAVAIPAYAITTWLGHAPRRREIALYKVEGWATVDVLELVFFENLLVSLAAAATALLIALIFVRALNAPLIAPFFLPDLPLVPEVRVPARFTPLPAVAAFVLSAAVTMTGSIWSTWRTAVARPSEVLR